MCTHTRLLIRSCIDLGLLGRSQQHMLELVENLPPLLCGLLACLGINFIAIVQEHAGDGAQKVSFRHFVLVEGEPGVC